MSKNQPKKKPGTPVSNTSPAAATASRPANSTTAPAASPRSGGMSPYLLYSVLLVVLTFVLYGNTLLNGFVLDDVIMVRDNTIVARGFDGIGELMATPHMRGYLVIPNDTYRPLSLVMFAIEHQFFGNNPGPYHFFNIVTFALCALLFFRFLHRFLDEKNMLAAFIGALIFVIHPVHTEVVANIKSRDEILCFLFAFLALDLFLNYMKTGKIVQLLLGGVVLYLSYISKENTITFLGVIPLLFLLFKNTDTKRGFIITGVSVVVAALFLFIRATILKEYNADISSDIEFIDNALVKAPNIMVRLATAVLISGKYLWLLFIPYPLLCNYSYNAIPFQTFGDVGVLVSLAAYLGL
ncbi:MAG: DUF1736 domain-containing protein, partial [Chitinophagia bacterium]|nr:DUF1736 domain-containing protein [Chitinophagia bacterium]